MTCKRRRGNPGKKRGSYKRRKFSPKFGDGSKTTSVEGYRRYMREYMKQKRKLLKRVGGKR